jgi:hypothetical protein
MPDLSLLLGAAVFAAGMLAGRFWPARRKGLRPQKPPQPICGCDHHLSYHDPQTGACHAQVYIGHWDWQDQHRACTCRQYAGPERLPEYFAPEIGS